MTDQQRVDIGRRLIAGELTEDDAKVLLHYCRDIAGWWPLATLCKQDVVDAWLKKHSPIPDLDNYAWTSAEYIASSWEGEDGSLAVDLAVEDIEDDAEADGHTWTTKEDA